ncbi:MAG TPA: mannitol-1-phosphate 5-dehydrogenase [Planctomycetota bacterium]|nr:mannitol-1-phosphate 5-dehydrogenase [Planctomycetota bacterium]
MKKAVHFGAGNIGRGFLGQLYSQSGWETVFVEVDPRVLEALNTRRYYRIEILGDENYFVDVTNVRGVDGRTIDVVADEIASADILGTSVGGAVLKHIAPAIAAGLAKRAVRKAPPVSILICENLLEAGCILKELILQHADAACRRYVETSVGFAETVVSRMVPVVPDDKRAADPLYIGVEAYAILPADKRGFPFGLPDIQGLEFHDNLEAYEERKLFTHNCGHCLCAYFGAEKGHEFVWQAVTDPQIRPKVLAALDETSRALIRKHNFTQEQQQEHVDDLLRRFANRALGDTVARVGRDPIRKLGPRDRLIGAARLVMETGDEPGNVIAGIRSALRYRNADDPAAVQLQQMIASHGLEYVLQQVCGLKPGEKLYRMIAEA